jgi:hypothetical protein
MCRSSGLPHVRPFGVLLDAPLRNGRGTRVRIQISKGEQNGFDIDGWTRGPFRSDFLPPESPPLSNDHVHEGIDSPDDPLRSLVARKPAIFLAETLGRARLEQAENVAGELGPDAAFGAQTSDGRDGPQRAAEVALFIRSGQR